MPDIFISDLSKKTTQEMPDIPTSPQNKNKIPNHQSHIPEKATPGMFSACIHHPQNFTFSQQEKDEKIILFMRRHFVTNLPWIIAAIIALIAPLLIISLSKLLDFSLFPLSLSLSITLISFYYLLVLGFALFNFADWYYNIGISSEKKLLDLDFTHLSHIDFALTQLPEIEDVVYKQKGFFASFFNYGDVIAHTVTGKEEFVFEKVPKPDQIVDIISRSIADTGH